MNHTEALVAAVSRQTDRQQMIIFPSDPGNLENGAENDNESIIKPINSTLPFRRL
jgi:hypothetical protein